MEDITQEGIELFDKLQQLGNGSLQKAYFAPGTIDPKYNTGNRSAGYLLEDLARKGYVEKTTAVVSIPLEINPEVYARNVVTCYRAIATPKQIDQQRAKILERQAEELRKNAQKLINKV